MMTLSASVAQHCVKIAVEFCQINEVSGPCSHICDPVYFFWLVRTIA